MPNININTAIALPPDMVWVDEVSWDKVSKTETVSVGGASIVQAQARTAGRRMTLESGSDFAFIRRSDLLALMALRDSGVESFPLVLGDGRTFDVQFAPTSEGSISATPAQPGKNPSAEDLYSVKLKFMEN